MLVVNERVDPNVIESTRAAFAPWAAELSVLSDTDETPDALWQLLDRLARVAQKDGQMYALLSVAHGHGRRALHDSLLCVERNARERSWWMTQRGLAALRLSAEDALPFWQAFHDVQSMAGARHGIQGELCVAGAFAAAGRLDQALTHARHVAERAPVDFGFQSHEAAVSQLHLALLLHRSRAPRAEVQGALDDVQASASELEPHSRRWISTQLAEVLMRTDQLGAGSAVLEQQIALAVSLGDWFPDPMPDLPFAAPADEGDKAARDLFAALAFPPLDRRFWMNVGRLITALASSARDADAAILRDFLARVTTRERTVRSARDVREEIAAATAFLGRTGMNAAATEIARATGVPGPRPRRAP
ncbi:MAG: hypothetical protein ABMB14_03265 [Myxococcota bacterium]